MELDNINQEDNWNPQPLKITAVITIIVSSLITLLFLAVIFMIEDYRGEIEAELAKQNNQDLDIDALMSMIKGIFAFLIIPFGLSIAGAAMMINRSNNGWILFLIAHVIIILFLFLGLLGGATPFGIALFLIYITLTILAGKYRYQKVESFEDYSN